MTLKEAKKILKKEMVFSFHSTKPFVFDESGWIEHEKPSVLEAFRVLAKGGYYISISGHDYNMREKRLKKEHEKNNKESAHDKKSMTLEEAKDMLMKEGFKLEGPGKPCDVSECFIELESPEICEAMQIVCSAGYMIMMEVCDFNARKARLKEQLEEHSNAPTSGSPALKEAASQFNDALLDEQGKKIKHLTKKIARLNKIIHKKNEELRLTKIREKNLAELSLKYVGENEKLKKKLADKIVAEIDARALKSAESALAYKEKVIAEKDEVIADLGNELAATKKELEEKTKLVETVRKASKQYCEYGIAAEKMIQKMANVIVYEGKVSSKKIEEYRRWANGYRYNPQLYDFIEEEEKKFSPVKDTHPTEDNPEEVKMNEILEHVRKVLEEGGTVYTSYDKAEEGGDQSATIVQHRKSIVDLFKEIKRLWQE